jgi:hypothetical protein
VLLSLSRSRVQAASFTQLEQFRVRTANRGCVPASYAVGWLVEFSSNGSTPREPHVTTINNNVPQKITTAFADPAEPMVTFEFCCPDKLATGPWFWQTTMIACRVHGVVTIVAAQLFNQANYCKRSHVMARRRRGLARIAFVLKPCTSLMCTYQTV